MRSVEINNSEIHGKGLFATNDFKVGEEIIKTTLPQADYKEGIDLMKYFGRTNEKGEYIKLGSLEFSLLRFLNHSNPPNAEYRDCFDDNALDKSEYSLIALKDIKKGEEITINYNIENFN